MDTPAQEYKTKDFHTAITIKSLGYDIKRLEPDEYGKGFFFFVFDDPKEELQQVALDRMNRKIMVESRLYEETFKEFKRKLTEIQYNQ